ncbi:MAG TPA: hypothetical protein VMZ91_06295, partial [Candidatus Paceibacterota bacterium]|nr:hypothetical protein [Candidatus Paceibacterota bacterium]
PALVKLAQVNLPIKVSFSLIRYSKNIENEFKIFIELREKIFKKYVTREDDNIVIPKEKIDEFNKKMTELLETEIELTPKESKPSIKISDLGDNVKISIADISALEAIIDFKDDSDMLAGMKETIPQRPSV